MAVLSSMMGWYFRKRMLSIEHGLKHAAETQHKVLKRLIDDAKDTEWGKQFDYRSIKSYSDFKQRVPIQDYDSLKPYIEKVMKGEVKCFVARRNHMVCQKQWHHQRQKQIHTSQF